MWFWVQTFCAPVYCLCLVLPTRYTMSSFDPILYITLLLFAWNYFNRGLSPLSLCRGIYYTLPDTAWSTEGEVPGERRIHKTPTGRERDCSGDLRVGGEGNVCRVFFQFFLWFVQFWEMHILVYILQELVWFCMLTSCTWHHDKNFFQLPLSSTHMHTQTKLNELQHLVKQLMLEKAQARLPKLGPRQHHESDALPPSPHIPHIPTPSPPHSPPSPTDVPVHLRPSSHHTTLSSPPPPAAVSNTMNIHEESNESQNDHEESPVTTATAEQIMQLLDQLEMDSHTGVALVVPCQCCTGEVISV